MIGQQTVKVRPRASALPPDERRAAIIASTVPLLVAHGTAITTQQIAAAAGIAEGTIFRVFPDKESLIAAAIEAAFDPAPVDDRLRAIDGTLPLEARLEAAVAILQRRVTDIGRLMVVVGRTNGPGGGCRQGPPAPPPLDALAGVFASDWALVRGDPLHAAQLLRGLAFAGTHPAFVIGEPLSATEIVSVFLDGMRVRDGMRDRRGPPC